MHLTEAAMLSPPDLLRRAWPEPPPRLLEANQVLRQLGGTGVTFTRSAQALGCGGHTALLHPRRTEAEFAADSQYVPGPEATPA